MGKKSAPKVTDDTAPEAKPKRHRKTKAALAAGAVASTVAATAAYRRRNSPQSQQAGPATPQSL